MISNTLFEGLKELLQIAKKINIKIAFMGGLAVSVWVEPRTTYDIDCIISTEKEKIQSFLEHLEKAGFSYDKKRPVKIISGYPFITLKKKNVFIDIFIASNEYQENIFSNISEIRFLNIKIPILSPEDLILIKFLSGRERDLIDAEAVISQMRKKLDINYLKSWAKKLEVWYDLSHILKNY